jgi:hypothetical protein
MSNGLFPPDPPQDPFEQFEQKRQGQESNIAGKLLEEAIENAFKRRGILVTSYQSIGEGLDLFEKRMLIRNAPYKSIYGARSFSEFQYRHANLRVRIECRSQQVAGSVDEKFPYLLMNAQAAMPEAFVWFVLEGIGARAKAIAWLKHQAIQTRAKTIRVLTLAEAQRAIKHLVERGAA